MDMSRLRTVKTGVLVIDEDTGKEVGYIQSGNSDGIEISLFDGKYRTRVNRCETAVGFVLGVQSVLNHMAYIDRKSASEAA
jgi:hypothetical protein